MTDPRAACSNCGAPGVGPYCPECGQEHRDSLDFPSYARRLAASVLELDGPVYRTLVSILSQPGRMTRAYIDGKRTSQIAPGKLYVATAAIYFFFAPQLGDGRTDFELASGDTQYLSIGPLTWDSEFMLLVLIPALAIVVQLLTLRSGRRFEDAFVFSVHYHVFFLATMLVVAASLVPLTALAMPIPAIVIAILGTLVAQPLYLVFAVRRAFGWGALASIGGAGVLFFAHMAIASLLFQLS